LQIFASCGGRDVARFCSDIIDDCLLEPGNEEVGSFFNDVLLHSLEISFSDDGVNR
jgi:hypothetical protein